MRRFFGLDHYALKHPSGLLDADGGVSSPRPSHCEDLACEVPFAFEPAQGGDQPVACIIHAFYPDALPPLLALLAHVPRPVDLYLSTDTSEKEAALRHLCEPYGKGSVEIRIVPNRGRDIAPKLIAFADVYPRYELFLHLHTKRSPHAGSSLARWNAYLTGTLLGTPEIVRSILSLFDDPLTGLVFPQHLFKLRKALRWGYNYDHARRLLGRMGIALQSDWPLDFPSGSMFWGRGAALRPLLHLGLSFEDFAPEAGQVDGTLAHAIERCMLHAVEHAGFRWVKIARRDLYAVPASILPIADEAALKSAVARVFRPCLPQAEPRASEQQGDTRPGHACLCFDGSELPLPRIMSVEDQENTLAMEAGIALWQKRDPVEAARWKIIPAGAGAAGIDEEEPGITLSLVRELRSESTSQIRRIVPDSESSDQWALAISTLIDALKGLLSRR